MPAASGQARGRIPQSEGYNFTWHSFGSKKEPDSGFGRAFELLSAIDDKSRITFFSRLFCANFAQFMNCRSHEWTDSMAGGESVLHRREIKSSTGRCRRRLASQTIY